jgi:cyclic dehypoxanthinyl futalosine synthase
MNMQLRQKITAGKPININDAEELYRTATMPELSALATHVKQNIHGTAQPTYLIMAIINYTNICVAKCDYCAFYRLPHQEGTYLLGIEEICRRIDTVVALGGTLVGFNGGFHPKLRIQDYAAIFAEIRRRYDGVIEFYGMTVAEFMFACKVSRITYSEGAEILAANGSRWITGGGAEVLVDSFRARHSPGKYKTADYYAAQEAVLRAGLGSTATMVIGFDETLAERLEHLKMLRNFQERMGNALPSFLCWTYKPYNTALGGEEIATDDYLRWLAICRIYLHNFKHIRTSVLTKNVDALAGLHFGADDFDLPTEDEVTERAGAVISRDFDSILASARELEFAPQLRTPFAVTSQREAPQQIPCGLQPDHHPC